MSPLTSLGRAEGEGLSATDRTGVGADIDHDLTPEVFGQVEIVLPEFSNLASVVYQLLQRLLRDFWIAATKLQTKRAPRAALEELLQEHGGEKDDNQDVVDAVYVQFRTLRSEVGRLMSQHMVSVAREEQLSIKLEQQQVDRLRVEAEMKASILEKLAI